MDSVPGPSSPQYWDPSIPYGWDANLSPTTPYSYLPYYSTDYSTDLQAYDPTMYSSTSGYMNFNPTQDQNFCNHYATYYPAAIPSGSSSGSSTPSTTPPTLTASAKPTSTKITKVKPTPTRTCSNCFTTNSCKWKDVKSKSNILCNTCFIYKRRNGEDRPAKAITAHQTMQMHLNK
ncbi:hypothetical protein CAEBREN_20682 [Caenorhabditis brenneri]|uniref:GATA-type domain-containing protein n=1 Tax=Caenorhabditis brenneri TaxID=135651 RepID=G0MW51_CAEBE|nr:hypothetical protein CAEBREN_20682 [Caenorhabditis brenneri]